MTSIDLQRKIYRKEERLMGLHNIFPYYYIPFLPPYSEVYKALSVN